MGLRLTKGDEDALWQIRLAGGSACPTLAPVGQALPPANRRLQRSLCLLVPARPCCKLNLAVEFA